MHENAKRLPNVWRRQSPPAGSVAGSGAVWGDGFVRQITGAAFDAVVNRNRAERAERFVVKSGNAQSGAQLFVEFAQTLQMRGERRKFQAVVGEQEFLIPGVPQSGKLALDHDRRDNGHLKFGVGGLAEFRAATVFFDAHHAASSAHSESQRSQAFNGFRIETLFDIPHGPSRLKKAGKSVKSGRRRGSAGFLGPRRCMLLAEMATATENGR